MSSISIPNFKLFFGKHKGKYFSETPLTYQSWLAQTEFFKSLTIKYPRKVMSKSIDGGVWWETQMVNVILLPKVEVISTREVDPEEKYYRDVATWMERDSDNGSDY